AYPELIERRALIEDITKQEEERFRRTLDRGLELIAENRNWGTAQGGQRVLPGAVAFKLYDTYGFPLDLQEVIGQEQGFAIDQAGFERELEGARERSQGSKVGERAVERVYHQLAEKLGKTEFLGYEQERAEGAVTALLADAAEVAQLEQGQEGEIIADRTPFYGESGGQVGDRGEIRTDSGVFEVLDTVKPTEGLFVHRGRVKSGTVRVKSAAQFEV